MENNMQLPQKPRIIASFRNTTSELLFSTAQQEILSKVKVWGQRVGQWSQWPEMPRRD